MDTAPLAPMEAKLAAELPEPPGWQYEPKWDGFRALAAREGDRIELWSKSGKPLARYFPEMVAALGALPEPNFLLDGELVIPIGERLSFDSLQARLHPAASRIARLSKETPAQLILFDCLRLGELDLRDRPLDVRRAALAGFIGPLGTGRVLLSPASLDRHAALGWLAQSGGALDGVIAKPLDAPYAAGERAMTKVKQRRTADCVVGGYRETAGGAVASLLLGLYDKNGKLDHVGFTSAFSARDRAALPKRLAPHRDGPGFTGDAPGGPSRWNGGKANPYVPLKHELVVEVLYDQVTAGRFRHATRLLRWRPDKAPRQCTREQLVRELSPAELLALIGSGP
jgi:ATP-dependent DNA ligase